MIRQEDIGRLRRFDSPPPATAGRPATPQPIQRPAAVPVYARPRSAAPLTTPAPVVAAAPISPADQPEAEAALPLQQPAKRLKVSHRHAIFAGLAGLLIIAASGSLLALHHADANPIPANYQSSVDFPTYYPDPSKLPPGFSFDPTSISSPVNNILVYHINYGKGYQIYVSLQDKPSSDNLQTFDDQRIPLHTTVNTPVGQAVVGAIANQTIVSLPTNAKTWIIVTAPHDINQKQLDQVLQSFKD